jgi:hypothetical protein
VLHLDLQVVDERLWDDEDEKGGDEEGRGQRKEEYDDKGTLQVDDKKDLEYEVRVRGSESEGWSGSVMCELFTL